MTIVLHGALGSAHQFDAFSGVLVDETFAIIEFPGHGSAPDVEGDWSIGLFSSFLEKQLEALPEPASVFGYSMGGYVALDCALRRPELFRRIVTLGTKLDWTRQGAEREVRFLDPDGICAKVPRYAEDLQRRHGPDRWKTVLQKTASLMLHLGESPVLTPERVALCTVPIRYGLGDSDEMVTLQETTLFRTATPNAELCVLPSTKHPIERVSQRNLQFLLQ